MKNIKVWGAGFSCVDIINCADSLSISLGGTAANVMTILSQLGFDTKFLTAEYTGGIEGWYRNALLIRHIVPVYFQKSGKRLSVILEDINPSSNIHLFKTSCPNCGNSLMNVILPSVEKVENLKMEMDDCNLLFYDRFSSGIKFLANANICGWNVYEPNAFRMYANLLSGCQSADIIKFSAERIPDRICDQLLHDLKFSRAKIIIVTMGQKGLRFAVKMKEEWGQWNYLPSIYGENVVDTAGAGDWLTASFLYELLSEYPLNQMLEEKNVIGKLERAQVIAMVACGYIGAQGILKEPRGVEQLNSLTGEDFWVLQSEEMGVKLDCPICGF